VSGGPCHQVPSWSGKERFKFDLRLFRFVTVSGDGGSSLRLFKNREFVALASTAFARSQAYSTILIALALYAEQFGTTGTVEGLFGTVFAVMQLVVVLPLGRYIDTSNSKRFLLAGLAINVAVFVGFAMVQSVNHVLLMRVFQGLGASVLWLTGGAVTGEISPDDSRGLWLGTYNQVGAFSSLAGDLVGGYLLFAYGFQWTYAVLTVITSLAFVSVFLFLRDNPGGKKDPEESTGLETYRTLLGRSAIRALVFFRGAFSFGKMAVIIFVPIYAKTGGFGINEFVVGGIMAGGKLTKSLTQGYVGDLTDRIGSRFYFVLAGAVVYALGTAMIPLAEFAGAVFPSVTLGVMGGLLLPPAFFALFGAYAVLGVADSLRLPASMALFVEEGEHFDAVAGSLSLRSIAWKFGQILGPVTVGVIWDATSVFVAFGAAAGMLVLSALVFAVLYTLDPAPEGADVAPGD
jgi:DHA1 family multidrug resistance protein-like MFS transporter